MAKYGYFSEKGNEYIITDYLTPRPQMNYVWNERMLSGFNHFGGGVGAYGNRAASYIDAEGRGRAVLISDGNRYFYINDNGDIWNPGWYPARNDIENYSCTHGIGYTKIKAEKNSMEAEIFGFVGKDKPCELWRITLTNKGNTQKSVRLYSFVEFALTGYQTYSEYDSYVSADYYDELNLIFAQNTAQERPHEWYNGYIAISEKPQAFDTSRNAFIGLYNDISKPDSVVNGCKNSLAACEKMVGAFENVITLEQGETKMLYVIIGSADTVDTAKRYVGELMGEKAFDGQLDYVKAHKSRLIEKVLVKTPVKKINHITNYWVKNQVQLCAEAGRATGKGFRDQLQDAWAIVAFDAQMAKVKIKETLEHQYSDGRCVRGWLPLDHHIYSDGPTWIAPTINAYLKETGDFAFLDEPVKYLDGVNATVWEHIICAAEYSANDLGAHGLVKAHDGDWNDSLNGIGVNGKGESVWTSIALCYALLNTAEMAEYIKKDKPLAEKMMTYYHKMKHTINQNAWDGEWYLAGYTDDGNPVGSHTESEGMIYLNSQTWAILAGVCDGERLKMVRDAVKKYLLCDFGPLTLYPAYTKYNKSIGRLTGFVPGIWENGTPYCHGGTFKIMSDLISGNPDDALESLLSIMPDSEKNSSDHSGCEPYVYTNMYFGPGNRRAGQTSFAWVTGTAGWMFRVVTQNMAGFIPCYDGFEIKPCIPSGWDYFEETRKFRSDTYIIEIHNHTGCEKIEVDGKASNCYIPLCNDGKTHKISVSLK